MIRGKQEKKKLLDEGMVAHTLATKAVNYLMTEYRHVGGDFAYDKALAFESIETDISVHDTKRKERIGQPLMSPDDVRAYVYSTHENVEVTRSQQSVFDTISTRCIKWDSLFRQRGALCRDLMSGIEDSCYDPEQLSRSHTYVSSSPGTVWVRMSSTDPGFVAQLEDFGRMSSHVENRSIPSKLRDLYGNTQSPYNAVSTLYGVMKNMVRPVSRCGNTSNAKLISADGNENYSRLSGIVKYEKPSTREKAQGIKNPIPVDRNLFLPVYTRSRREDGGHVSLERSVDGSGRFPVSRANSFIQDPSLDGGWPTMARGELMKNMVHSVVDSGESVCSSLVVGQSAARNPPITAYSQEWWVDGYSVERTVLRSSTGAYQNRAIMNTLSEWGTGSHGLGGIIDDPMKYSNAERKSMDHENPKIGRGDVRAVLRGMLPREVGGLHFSYTMMGKVIIRSASKAAVIPKSAENRTTDGMQTMATGDSRIVTTGFIGKCGHKGNHIDRRYRSRANARDSPQVLRSYGVIIPSWGPGSANAACTKDGIPIGHSLKLAEAIEEREIHQTTRFAEISDKPSQWRSVSTNPSGPAVLVYDANVLGDPSTGVEGGDRDIAGHEGNPPGEWKTVDIRTLAGYFKADVGASKSKYPRYAYFVRLYKFRNEDLDTVRRRMFPLNSSEERYTVTLPTCYLKGVRPPPYITNITLYVKTDNLEDVRIEGECLLDEEEQSSEFSSFVNQAFVKNAARDAIKKYLGCPEPCPFCRKGVMVPRDCSSHIGEDGRRLLVIQSRRSDFLANRFMQCSPLSDEEDSCRAMERYALVMAANSRVMFSRDAGGGHAIVRFDLKKRRRRQDQVHEEADTMLHADEEEDYRYCDNDPGMFPKLMFETPSYVRYYLMRVYLEKDFVTKSVQFQNALVEEEKALDVSNEHTRKMRRGARGQRKSTHSAGNVPIIERLLNIGFPRELLDWKVYKDMFSGRNTSVNGHASNPGVGEVNDSSAFSERYALITSRYVSQYQPVHNHYGEVSPWVPRSFSEISEEEENSCTSYCAKFPALDDQSRSYRIITLKNERTPVSDYKFVRVDKEKLSLCESEYNHLEEKLCAKEEEFNIQLRKLLHRTGMYGEENNPPFATIAQRLYPEEDETIQRNTALKNALGSLGPFMRTYLPIELRPMNDDKILELMYREGPASIRSKRVYTPEFEKFFNEETSTPTSGREGSALDNAHRRARTVHEFQDDTDQSYFDSSMQAMLRWRIDEPPHEGGVQYTHAEWLPATWSMGELQKKAYKSALEKEIGYFPEQSEKQESEKRDSKIRTRRVLGMDKDDQEDLGSVVTSMTAPVVYHTWLTYMSQVWAQCMRDTHGRTLQYVPAPNKSPGLIRDHLENAANSYKDVFTTMFTNVLFEVFPIVEDMGSEKEKRKNKRRKGLVMALASELSQSVRLLAEQSVVDDSGISALISFKVSRVRGTSRYDFKERRRTGLSSLKSDIYTDFNELKRDTGTIGIVKDFSKFLEGENVVFHAYVSHTRGGTAEDNIRIHLVKQYKDGSEMYHIDLRNVTKTVRQYSSMYLSAVDLLHTQHAVRLSHKYSKKSVARVTENEYGERDAVQEDDMDDTEEARGGEAKTSMPQVLYAGTDNDYKTRNSAFYWHVRNFKEHIARLLARWHRKVRDIYTEHTKLDASKIDRILCSENKLLFRQVRSREEEEKPGVLYYLREAELLEACISHNTQINLPSVNPKSSQRWTQHYVEGMDPRCPNTVLESTDSLLQTVFPTDPSNSISHRVHSDFTRDMMDQEESMDEYNKAKTNPEMLLDMLALLPRFQPNSATESDPFAVHRPPGILDIFQTTDRFPNVLVDSSMQFSTKRKYESGEAYQAFMTTKDPVLIDDVSAPSDSVYAYVTSDLRNQMRLTPLESRNTNFFAYGTTLYQSIDKGGNDMSHLFLSGDDESEVIHGMNTYRIGSYFRVPYKSSYPLSKLYVEMPGESEPSREKGFAFFGPSEEAAFSHILERSRAHNTLWSIENEFIPQCRPASYTRGAHFYELARIFDVRRSNIDMKTPLGPKTKDTDVTERLSMGFYDQDTVSKLWYERKKIPTQAGTHLPGVTSLIYDQKVTTAAFPEHIAANVFGGRNESSPVGTSRTSSLVAPAGYLNSVYPLFYSHRAIRFGAPILSTKACTMRLPTFKGDSDTSCPYILHHSAHPPPEAYKNKSTILAFLAGRFLRFLNRIACFLPVRNKVTGDKRQGCQSWKENHFYVQSDQYNSFVERVDHFNRQVPDEDLGPDLLVPITGISTCMPLHISYFDVPGLSDTNLPYFFEDEYMYPDGYAAASPYKMSINWAKTPISTKVLSMSRAGSDVLQMDAQSGKTNTMVSNESTHPFLVGYTDESYTVFTHQISNGFTEKANIMASGEVIGRAPPFNERMIALERRRYNRSMGKADWGAFVLYDHTKSSQGGDTFPCVARPMSGYTRFMVLHGSCSVPIFFTMEECVALTPFNDGGSASGGWSAQVDQFASKLCTSTDRNYLGKEVILDTGKHLDPGALEYDSHSPTGGMLATYPQPRNYNSQKEVKCPYPEDLEFPSVERRPRIDAPRVFLHDADSGMHAASLTPYTLVKNLERSNSSFCFDEKNYFRRLHTLTNRALYNRVARVPTGLRHRAGTDDVREEIHLRRLWDEAHSERGAGVNTKKRPLLTPIQQRAVYASVSLNDKEVERRRNIMKALESQALSPSKDSVQRFVEFPVVEAMPYMNIRGVSSTTKNQGRAQEISMCADEGYEQSDIQEIPCGYTSEYLYRYHRMPLVEPEKYSDAVDAVYPKERADLAALFFLHLASEEDLKWFYNPEKGLHNWTYATGETAGTDLAKVFVSLVSGKLERVILASRNASEVGKDVKDYSINYLMERANEINLDGTREVLCNRLTRFVDEIIKDNSVFRNFQVYTRLVRQLLGCESFPLSSAERLVPSRKEVSLLTRITSKEGLDGRIISQRNGSLARWSFFAWIKKVEFCRMMYARSIRENMLIHTTNVGDNPSEDRGRPATSAEGSLTRPEEEEEEASSAEDEGRSETSDEVSLTIFEEEREEDYTQ